MNSEQMDKCKRGDHQLVRILTRGQPDDCSVVRWCECCGSVVVDWDFDGRVHAGRVMAMRKPSSLTLDLSAHGAGGGT